MDRQEPARPDDNSQIHNIDQLMNVVAKPAPPTVPASRRRLGEGFVLGVVLVVAVLIMAACCLAGFALNITAHGPLD